MCEASHGNESLLFCYGAGIVYPVTAKVRKTMRAVGMSHFDFNKMAHHHTTSETSEITLMKIYQISRKDEQLVLSIRHAHLIQRPSTLTCGGPSWMWYIVENHRHSRRYGKKQKRRGALSQWTPWLRVLV
jgi:hypothetical protein